LVAGPELGGWHTFAPQRNGLPHASRCSKHGHHERFVSGDFSDPRLGFLRFGYRVRFFPSCITLRRMRLIRVWYPGPFDLNQSTTSRSTRSEIRCFRGRFQRDSGLASSSASENKSSSTAANSSMVAGRALDFRLFFLDLCVITELYIPYRHHVTFLQEH
jgi:hypothetical protein